MNTAAGLVISRGWMSVCAFVTFILVARNLTQAEFGVFALASSASVLPQMLVGAGFYEYVIGRDSKGLLQRDAESWSMLSGVAGAALVLAFAGFAALVMQAADAAWLLAGFSIVSVLWGYSSIQEAALIRDGRGGAVALVLFLAETVGLVALIAAFENGAGVFSLLVGRLANAAVVFAGFMWRTRRGIAIQIDVARARAMLRYSGGAVGNRVVRWANGWGIDLVVGLVMSLANVGLFRMGMRIFYSGSAILLEAPQAAILKYLGQAHASGETRMRRITLRVHRLHTALAAPIFVGGAAIAGVFVDTVLGSDWAASGQVFAILCLSAPLLVAMGVNGAVLLASGRTHTLFLYQAGTTVLAMLALLGGGLGGPVSAAVARVAMGAVIVTTAGWVIQKEIGREGRTAFLFNTARLLAATACMAVWTLGWVLRVPATAPLAQKLGLIAAAGLSGLVVYAAALFVFDRASFRLLRAAWRLLRRPRRAHATATA